MLLQIDENRPSPQKIERVVDVLRMGGVIIYPTDTVYAFGCDLFHITAIKKLAKLRKKEEGADFSIVCYDMSMVSEYVMPIPNRYYRLMRKVLPGPYTFILKANSNTASLFPRRRATIGIRIPDNRIARAIVRALGHPMVTTSLKEDAGGYEEYRTDPEYIYQNYYRLVDLVIDGGFGRNEPSTVIDLTGEKPVIVREGIGDITPFIDVV